MIRYKILFMLMLLIFSVFIENCGPPKSFMKIPLSYGKELSGDSVEFKNINFITLYEAILKVKGEQRERIFYQVEEISSNLFRIEEAESSAYYEVRPSINYAGVVTPSPLSVVERKRSFNVNLKIMDQQTIMGLRVRVWVNDTLNAV